METEQRRAGRFRREARWGINNPDTIPVEVVPSGQGHQADGIFLSVMNEIAAMLEALIASGKTASIDLRRAPLGARDRARLRDVLGQGEIEARINCLGLTHLKETAVSGVWWVTHYSEDRRMLGEFVEVTTCPELLSTSPADLHAGLTLLHTRLSAETHAPDPEDIARRLKAMGLASGDGVQCSPNADGQTKGGNSHAE